MLDFLGNAWQKAEELSVKVGQAKDTLVKTVETAKKVSEVVFQKDWEGLLGLLDWNLAGLTETFQPVLAFFGVRLDEFPDLPGLLEAWAAKPEEEVKNIVQNILSD